MEEIDYTVNPETIYIVNPAEETGSPHVIAQFVSRYEADFRSASWGADGLMGRREMEARYPEPLKAWEAQDPRPYVLHEALWLPTVEPAVQEGIGQLRQSADLAAKYDLGGDDPFLEALVRHRDAIKELEALVRARHAAYERQRDAEKEAS